MGDDGLLGGTTVVDDLRITGNISGSSANTSLIGGKNNDLTIQCPLIGYPL